MRSILITAILTMTAIPAGAPAAGATQAPAAPLAASPGGQQARSAREEQPPIRAKLADFPSWLGPQDSLRMTLRVTNTTSRGAADLRVAFLIYDAVDSRSRLQSTFRGARGSLLGSDTIPVEGGLEAGATRTITVEKPLAEISAVRSSPDDGAYPVRIVVRADRLVSEPIDTSMIFFTGPPAKVLDVGLVIPLHSPSIYTDGRRPRVVTSNSLEKSLSPPGRLARILTALEEHPEAPVTLAPSGLLLDMLADLENGYSKQSGKNVLRVGPQDPTAHVAAQTLARLRLLAARPDTRVIPMPYSAASLGALVEASLDDLAQSQVVESRNRLSAEPGGILGITQREDWVLPAYRSLDERTLAALQRSGISKMVLSPSSLREPAGALTRPAAAQVKSRAGSVLALIEDNGLKAILNPPASQSDPPAKIDPLITRQRFLADTATILLERPGLKRGVLAVSPLDWAPRGPELNGILTALQGTIWMQGATVDTLAALPPPSESAVPLAGPEAVGEKIPEPPSKDYYTKLREARRAIQKFAELAPPPDRLAGLDRRLLIAESADWWVSRALSRRGGRFAEAIPAELAKQTKSIEAPGAQVITLTSRTGVIPLSVASSLKYPVDVVVKLDSDKLSFPEGNRIPIQKLEAPARTIEVKTIAQATGTFPLRVTVETSTGRILSQASLTIRSTAYNVVAVSITAGAAVFLLGWWAAGWVRRKVPRPK